jgi:hypothetical protein
MRESPWITKLVAGVAVMQTIFLCSVGHTTAQNRRHGPEVRSFLSLLKQEEAELDFQIRHNEISRPEFTRSKNRIAVLRQAVLDHVARTRKDQIPEYHVVTGSELDTLIPEGLAAVKAAKPGDTIDEKWRFVGTATRGEQFFIVERVSKD